MKFKIKAEETTLSDKQVLTEFAKLQKYLDNFRLALRNDYPFIDDECSRMMHEINALYSKVNKYNLGD